MADAGISFAQRLRMLMLLRNRNKHMMAPISADTVKHWRAGRYLPRTGNLRMVAQILRVPKSALTAGTQVLPPFSIVVNAEKGQKVLRVEAEGETVFTEPVDRYAPLEAFNGTKILRRSDGSSRISSSWQPPAKSVRNENGPKPPIADLFSVFGPKNDGDTDDRKPNLQVEAEGPAAPEQSAGRGRVGSVLDLISGGSADRRRVPLGVFPNPEDAADAESRREYRQMLLSVTEDMTTKNLKFAAVAAIALSSAAVCLTDEEKERFIRRMTEGAGGISPEETVDAFGGLLAWAAALDNRRAFSELDMPWRDNPAEGPERFDEDAERIQAAVLSQDVLEFADNATDSLISEGLAPKDVGRETCSAVLARLMAWLIRNRPEADVLELTEADVKEFLKDNKAAVTDRQIYDSGEVCRAWVRYCDALGGR